LLPDRLTWIDDTNRHQHIYLQPGDQCLFFGEYFARKGYEGGGTNQLILNFKCKPSAAATNPARSNHKERAIASIAAGLRRSLAPDSVERMTFVPIPTSKIIGHADCDDRLTRSLAAAFSGYNADIRLLLRQVKSTESDHTAGNRLSPDVLHSLLQIDQDVLAASPLKDAIVLFDDVITTGKHFKSCERRLRDEIPAAVPIMGLFVARRILSDPSDDFEAVTLLP
jgi:hypothetical protein